MNIFIIAAAFIIILAGVFYRQKITVPVRPSVLPSPTVKPPAPTPTIEVTPTKNPVRPKITNTPYLRITPAPTHESGSNSQSGLPTYPGASVTENSGSVTVLSTTDSPETVTSWYESKMNEMGLNAKSFVKTNTNGNVNNKLSGASSKADISVSITRSPGDTATRIEISQKYY